MFRVSWGEKVEKQMHPISTRVHPVFIKCTLFAPHRVHSIIVGLSMQTVQIRTLCQSAKGSGLLFFWMIIDCKKMRVALLLPSFCLFSLLWLPLFEDCFAFFAFAEADYVRKQGSYQCIHYVFRYARNHFGRLVYFSHGN